jgi:hypothetical protein
MAKLILVVMLLAPGLAVADTYRSNTDNAGYTHYYDSRGHQTCVSKKDANGNTHYNCN